MKQFILIATIFLTTLGVSSTSYADEQMPIVASMKFVDDTDGEVSVERVKDRLGTVVGERLNSTTLLKDVNMLHRKLPQYKNISTKVDPIEGDNDRVNVTFEFQLKRTVEMVRIVIKEDIEIPLNLKDKLTTFKGAVFNARKNRA